MSRTPLATPLRTLSRTPLRVRSLGQQPATVFSEAEKGAGPAQHMRMRPLGCPRTAFHALISYEYDRIRS
eukprot:scaffold89856_cov69-Phaeocystis_antarctica.AAC.2